jgi:hypothetical protein
MNARYLLFTLFVLIVVGLSIRSRSTLTPERGVDQVFYGSYNNFMAQEVTSGDFDGDGLDDVVASLLWDSPGGCDAVPQRISSTFACQNGIGRWVAEKGVEDTLICAFSDPDLAEAQRAYWEDECGWTVVDTLSCGECWQARWFGEDQGAVYVELGGDWSGKGHDIDFPTAGSDHMVVGQKQGDGIYNGLAAGNVDANLNNHDELILGADQRRNGGPGEVYVISGGDAWPDTIRPPDDDLVMHYFLGRDSLDAFGAGIAAGDLNDDGEADIVVAAPHANGPSNDRAGCGEVYVFYSVQSLDTLETVDLSQLTDGQLGSSTYAQVIWGAAEHDSAGVTLLWERHQEHGNHRGNYEPAGLAIGDWDGDGRNDLAIGAGSAGGAHSAYQGGDGAVYVIFGGGVANKLRPGNTIDLSGTLGTSNAADVRIVGKDGSALGAGVAFVDADGEGAPGPGEGGKDDLVLGAPYAVLGGDSVSWDYKGEAYIIWGDTKGNLTSNADRSAGDSNDIDVTITGQDGNDQLGGHITGNKDVDGDGKNDVGIAGQDAVFVFFGQDRGEWESEIDLGTVLNTDPDTRILALKNVGPEANSTTIRFATVDTDNYDDLIFGGYDLPGIGGQAFPDQAHAGQMWMMRGSDLWKSGSVSSSQTWSGNVFVHGDIVVEDGATLTIDAGTDVWIWPKDPDSSDDVWPSYPLHFDTTLVEFRVYGNLVVDGANGNPVRIQGWTMEGPDSDAPDLWWGIHVHDGSATFDYCEIRNARMGIQANVPVTITNSTIENIDLIALSVSDADSVYVDEVTFRDIGYMGVNALEGTRIRVSDSEFSDLGDYGIRAYSGAKLYMDNSTIGDADLEAISIEDEDTYALIEDCTIEDNYRGLRADVDAVMVVEGTTVDQSENYGIYSLYDATLGIDGCTVKNADAAVAIFESNATLIESLLRDSDVGLLSLQGSAPAVEGCDIIYNDIGVLAMQGGLPNLGTGGSYGYNEIHHSTTYNVSNLTTPDTLKAEYDYWKNHTTPCTPPTSKINGLVDFYPAICSPPSPVSIRPAEPQDVPATYVLSPNYPNPFNPTTTVPYVVASPGGKVAIAIYNVRGQLVRTLVNGHKAAGYHSVVWDGASNQGATLSSGVYFLRMRAPGFEHTRKLVLLK